ncbi:hypothetical protein GCM10009765_34960 [Fodinicola feengrottensis]|uniref:Uncharacterized protein n=2 Tax=Fodinicola feengrottensis TaxID=435914 RepID=A0ABN2H6V4_9ACTN
MAAIAVVAVIAVAAAAFLFLRPSGSPRAAAPSTPVAPTGSAAAVTPASPTPGPVQSGPCPQAASTLKPKLIEAAYAAIGGSAVAKNVTFVNGPVCDGGSYAWGLLKAQDAGGEPLDQLAMLFKVDGGKVTVPIWAAQCLQPAQFPAGAPAGSKQSLACQA